jgi:hypothetical protein
MEIVIGLLQKASKWVIRHDRDSSRHAQRKWTSAVKQDARHLTKRLKAPNCELRDIGLNILTNAIALIRTPKSQFQAKKIRSKQLRSGL